MKNPLVTIACITYNHGDFIKQTLDGFLAQEVDFTYEIIVHDDASTDNTQEVLKEYKAKYPEIFRLTLRTENLYSKGVSKIFYHETIKKARGKYIASCEGDDYWINPKKLQMQIEFLEQNPDFTFSVGRVMTLNENTKELLPRKELIDYYRKEFYTLKDYLKSFFSQTSTYVFRKEGYDMPAYCNNFSGEDILMVVLGTREGKIKFHDEVFSVYRIHEGGVTQQEYNWRMQYYDIYNYTTALEEIVNKKYFLVFLSIKIRLYLIYRGKVAGTKLMRYIYHGFSLINDNLRRKVL